jgi:hypothetical protein
MVKKLIKWIKRLFASEELIRSDIYQTCLNCPAFHTCKLLNRTGDNQCVRPDLLKEVK